MLMPARILGILAACSALAGAVWLPTGPAPALAGFLAATALGWASLLASRNALLSLRLTAVGEVVLLSAVVLIGILWPSVYTLVAVAALPVGILCLISAAWPRVLVGKRGRQYVVLATAGVAILCLGYSGWNALRK